MPATKAGTHAEQLLQEADTLMSNCAPHIRASLAEEQHKQEEQKQLKTLTTWTLIGILLILINNLLSPFIDNYTTFPPQIWSGFLIVIETYTIFIIMLISISTEQTENQK